MLCPSHLWLFIETIVLEDLKVLLRFINTSTQMLVSGHNLSVEAGRRPGRPGCDAGLWEMTFVCVWRETVVKFWECRDWFRPTSFVFPDYIFGVNHHRRVIYWHGWYFCSTQPPHHHHHHHLVYPLLCLIPSINASRQALGYHSSSTLLSCTLMSLHPSSSFSIKG